MLCNTGYDSMKRTFIQTGIFEKRLRERGGDELLRAVEAAVLDNPEAGDVIQGTGGVRKLRVADPGRGKGKRGGFRVLFLDLPRVSRTYLLYFYGKDESEDLTAAEKKIFAEIVRAIKGSQE